MDRVPPEGLLGLSILSVQIGSALATTLFEQIGPSGISLLKAGFSAVVLVAISRAWRQTGLLRHGPVLLLFGAAIAMMFASSYETLARLPMGVAATIGFLGPLGLAVLHGRRASHFLFVALALAGVVLLTPDLLRPGWGSSWAGLIWAAASALSWAAFVVISPRVGRVLPGLRGLAVGTAVATVLLAPYALLEGGVERATASTLEAAFAVAVLATIVPLSLEFSALRRMSPRGYGVMVSTEPAVAGLVGALLLGQSLDPAGAVGIAVVCLASLGMAWSDRRA